MVDSLRVSVVMPCYNEIGTIRAIVARVASVPVVDEIVIVDDHSRDGTREVLAKIERDYAGRRPRIRVLYQSVNRGKGAALRSGFHAATGEIILVQDADLEYDPAEYPKLIEPILEGKADVVYGSRFLGSHRVLFFWHSVGNKLLTLLSNIATNLNLTDMETCYKVFKSEIIKDIPLREERFGFEPEVTAKIAKLGCRIHEVPISYYGRSYAEGKKIGWKDGLRAFWVILKYWLMDDVTESDVGHFTLRLIQKAHKYNEWVWGKIKPFVGQRVLEIGSGVGNISRYLTGCDEVTLSDVSPKYVHELSLQFGNYPNVTVRRLDVSQNGMPIGRFDTVVCLNVLEHIADDEGALRSLWNVLEPGGTVVLLVPHDPRLYSGLDRELGHVRRYRKAELAAKLARAGFTIKSLRGYNILGAVGWWVNGRLLGRRRLSPTQIRFYNHFVPLLKWEERFESSCSMTILAIAGKR